VSCAVVMGALVKRRTALLLLPEVELRSLVCPFHRLLFLPTKLLARVEGMGHCAA